MKTIIHIGQHKTGTTSIQNFLRDNRKALLKNGFYVPSRIAGYDHPSHFILNVYALAEGRYSSMKDELVSTKGKQYIDILEIKLKRDIEHIYKDASQKKSKEVLWSNEGLYLLNTVAEYKRLIGLFSEYSTEVEVVCCFRDVKSYRNSYIKQLRKQNIPLSDNPDSYRYVEPDSWLFDYKKKQDLLSEVFDKCTYFLYDPNDNVKKFLEAIGGYDNISTGGYRLNVTGNARSNLLQKIKKRLASA